MLKKIFETKDDANLLILRIMLGLVFFPHGMAKLTTMFGGFGFEGTLGFFTGKLGIPVVFAVLAILAEGLGWIGLLSGFLTRIAAFGISVNMAVAVYMLHWQNGFFMNWFGNQKGEGYEFHLLVFAIGIVLMTKGGGKWSFDKAIASNLS